MVVTTRSPALDYGSKYISTYRRARELHPIALLIKNAAVAVGTWSWAGGDAVEKWGGEGCLHC